MFSLHVPADWTSRRAPEIIIRLRSVVASKLSAFAPKRPLDRKQKIAAFLIVAALHGLFFLDLSRAMRPPSTKGDGSNSQVAMSVALVPASVLEDPSSQGDDAKTETLVTDPAQTESSHSDPAKQAQGAGVEPAPDPGGPHDTAPGQTAPASRAGGGGGTKDDPWARASLTPDLNTNGVFDLAARNNALFLSRVQPCLGDKTAALAGVMVAVTLGSDGKVTDAEPVRPGVAQFALKPSKSEAQAIAAVRACGPYHDLVLGRTPVLKLPPSPSATPALAATTQHGSQG